MGVGEEGGYRGRGREGKREGGRACLVEPVVELSLEVPDDEGVFDVLED